MIEVNVIDEDSKKSIELQPGSIKSTVFVAGKRKQSFDFIPSTVDENRPKVASK